MKAQVRFTFSGFCFLCISLPLESHFRCSVEMLLRELTPVLGGYLILFFEDFRNFKKLWVVVFPNPSKNSQFVDKAPKEPIVLRLFDWFIENLRTTITLSESAFWTFTTKVMKSKNCPQNRPLLIPTQHWLMSLVQFLIPTKIPVCAKCKVWSCAIRQPTLEALCKIKVLKQQIFRQRAWGTQLDLVPLIHMYGAICLARDMFLVCQSTTPFALKHISYNHNILHKPQSASPREKTKTPYCKKITDDVGIISCE